MGMRSSTNGTNCLRKQIMMMNSRMNWVNAAKHTNQKLNDTSFDSLYEAALAKLSDYDDLKKLELEDELRFLDIWGSEGEDVNIRNPYSHLYHGVRFDSEHKLFESILRDREIRCGNKIDLLSVDYSDNCNEGKYVSLTDYSGFFASDLEFKTFIGENISFMIAPKLNPLKCKYLPYDEWEMIKTKLPKTRHRYSYAKGEYQYPECFSLDYVEGILYPFNYYSCIYGFDKTQEDFEYVKELLIKYGFEYLPILDQTDGFKVIKDQLTISDKKNTL